MTNSLDSFRESLGAAYRAGLEDLCADRTTRHISPEPYDSMWMVEQHRWFWRPDKPRLVLIAESHVYTSDADLGISIEPSLIASVCPSGQEIPPLKYVGLVYCLGYGESKLLLNRHAEFTTRSTWQYWDMFGRLAGTGKQPKASAGCSLAERLKWKIGTLARLKEIGIWLLDASAHAIYIGKRLRRSPECCQKLHEQWWRHYGSAVISGFHNPLVWVIGASTHGHLASLEGFKCRGFIYQPNARNVDLNHNWDRLMADVTGLLKNARPNPELVIKPPSG